MTNQAAPTNLTFAQEARLKPIDQVAEEAGLGPDDYEPLGRTKAKLTWDGVARLRSRAQGRLVLVTAMTPTPHGEGKTTTSVGLAQGLNRIGKRAMPALREPALGPIFGVKGGACGGGRSQVLPMEDINLFFNGDFPAISAAHNLLSAMLDAHVHNGNELGFDLRRPTWPRTVDMNDRALREITVGLGGLSNGQPRTDGFVITPASEVMAILCLADGLADLKARLGRIIAGYTRKGEPITAAQLGAAGAMTVLLREALRPNLVQTMEGGAALIHGGPFANIAHGCSSLAATQAALGMTDFVVTEGGFASDLGAEKFMNIVCPRLGRGPDAVVLVVTVRACRHHGEGDLEKGLANVRRHQAHLRSYGVPVVTAVNSFKDDTPDDHRTIMEGLEGPVAISDPWMGGGEGCLQLAQAVAEASSSSSPWQPLYSEGESLLDKMTKIAQAAYGAEGVDLSPEAAKTLVWLGKNKMAHLPVCMAKTQNSLSHDPSLKNAPTGFRVPIRELRVSAGAGFVVALTGDMMLMPGLGKEPAALKIDLNESGKIVGMF
jgi:formate--tetrahydrofolate ligase